MKLRERNFAANRSASAQSSPVTSRSTAPVSLSWSSSSFASRAWRASSCFVAIVGLLPSGQPREGLLAFTSEVSQELPASQTVSEQRGR